MAAATRPQPRLAAAGTSHEPGMPCAIRPVPPGVGLPDAEIESVGKHPSGVLARWLPPWTTKGRDLLPHVAGSDILDRHPRQTSSTFEWAPESGLAGPRRGAGPRRARRSNTPRVARRARARNPRTAGSPWTLGSRPATLRPHEPMPEPMSEPRGASIRSAHVPVVIVDVTAARTRRDRPSGRETW